MTEYYIMTDSKGVVQGVVNGIPDLPEGFRTERTTSTFAEMLERKLAEGKLITMPIRGRYTDYCPSIAKCGMRSGDIAQCVEGEYLLCAHNQGNPHLGKRGK